MNEIKDLSSRGAALGGASATVVLVGILAIWLSTARLTGAIILVGTVTYSEPGYTVRHFDRGIISKVFISEGDKVREGDLLIELDSEDVNLEAAILKDSLENVYARISVERAVLYSDSFTQYSNVGKIKTQYELAVQRQISWPHQIKRAQILQNSTNEQLSAIKRQSDAVFRQLENAEENLFSLEILEKKGLAASGRILALKSEVGRLESVIAALDFSKAQTLERRQMIAPEISVWQIERRPQALIALQSLETLATEIQAARDVLELRRSRLQLRAKVSGIVDRLWASTPGAVVNSGDPIAEIVLQESARHVTVAIPVDKVEHLAPGQKVVITAPSRVLGTTTQGTITWISHQARAADDQSSPTFRARIEIAADNSAASSIARLRGGTSVQVAVVTLPTTALELIIDRIRQFFFRVTI